MSRKEAYQEKMVAELEKWRAEIEKFKAQAKETKADAKIEYHQQLDELTDKQKDAEQKLRALNRAGTESWEELKVGVDNAVTALQQSFDRIKQKMQTVS